MFKLIRKEGKSIVLTLLLLSMGSSAFALDGMTAVEQAINAGLFSINDYLTYDSLMNDKAIDRLWLIAVTVVFLLLLKVIFTLSKNQNIALGLTVILSFTYASVFYIFDTPDPKDVLGPKYEAIVQAKDTDNEAGRRSNLAYLVRIWKYDLEKERLLQVLNEGQDKEKNKTSQFPVKDEAFLDLPNDYANFFMSIILMCVLAMQVYLMTYFWKQRKILNGLCYEQRKAMKCTKETQDMVIAHKQINDQLVESINCFIAVIQDGAIPTIVNKSQSIEQQLISIRLKMNTLNNTCIDRDDIELFMRDLETLLNSQSQEIQPLLEEVRNLKEVLKNKQQFKKIPED